MAACYISTGYTLDCRTSSTGGIKTMWVLGGAANSITGYTVTNSEVSAIGGTGTWFKFELPKQSGSLTETLGVNTTSQSVTFQPEIVVNLPKLQTELRNTFVDLVSQNEIYALIEDNNNRYWLVFLDNGGLVTAGSLNTGQAYTDLNGATALTMTGGEPTSIREVAVSTTIAAVFTAGGFTFQS
jgi:hypothetical protein